MTNSVVIGIENELKNLFDSLDSKWVKVSFILSKLNLFKLAKTEKYSKFPLEAILKLYIYKRIKGLSNHYEKVKEYFLNNQEEALDLGFFKNINNNIMFPPKRTYNYYLSKFSKEDLRRLDLIAEKILETANKYEKILDIELVKKTIEKKNKERTFKEAVKLIKKLIYPQINIKMHHNARFTTKELLDVLVHVAYSHDFTTNGSNTFKEIYGDKHAPNGEVLLYHFSKFNSKDNVKDLFKKIFDLIFDFTKKNYRLLSRKLDIAYDIHKIPYYGDKNDDFVVEGKLERGTTHFYQFLTCSIVIAGHRFVLDAVPLFKFDDLNEVLNESLIRVKSKININLAFFDRGFDKPHLVNTIKKNNIKFIMPKIRSSRVKALMIEFQDCKSKVIENFGYGKKEIALVNLVLVDDEDGIKRAFITNIKVSEEHAHNLFYLYSKRWGIETGYRQFDHDFKARTTSKNYHIRLFYFLFSVCLFNLWVLVNICVSLSLFGRLKKKPIITAKLFAIVLYKISIEPGG